MPSKFFQTPEFKQLESEWYDLLKDSGFKDAEIVVGSEKVLIQNAPNVFFQANSVVIEAKLEYFVSLSKAVEEETDWDHPLEKIILSMKAEGAKISEISKELKSIYNPRCRGYRQTIRFIIRKYENRWKIRKWAAHQLRIKTWKKPVTA